MIIDIGQNLLNIKNKSRKKSDSCSSTQHGPAIPRGDSGQIDTEWNRDLILARKTQSGLGLDRDVFHYLQAL